MNSKIVSISLVSVIVGIIAFSIFLWNKNIESSEELEDAKLISTLSKKLYETKSIYEELQNKYDVLHEEHKRLQEKYNNYRKLHMNRVALEERHIDSMKKKGLNDPIQNLIQNLKSHPELIPYKGIMGGIIGFNSEENIWILTKKLALAYFEDGHIGGYLLLEYLVKDDGTIMWEVLSSQKS